MRLIRLIILVLLWHLPISSLSQLPDSAEANERSVVPTYTADSALKSAREMLEGKKERVEKELHSLMKRLNKISDAAPAHLDSSPVTHPFDNLFTSKPLLQFTGGYASYHFNYRSNMDTPYVESNIAQHNVSGTMHFRIAGLIPLLALYRIQRSNSRIFRDITDVQLSFNANEFRNNLQSELRERLLSLTLRVEDTLTGKLYEIRHLQAIELRNWLNNPFHRQLLVEAYETLRVPHITYRTDLPDSTNAKREDSLKKVAAFFLEQYENIRKAYEEANGQADSLQKAYEQGKQMVKRYRELVNNWHNHTPDRLREELQKLGITEGQIPAKYRWLSGLRQFSVGRTPVNYTDLTANNVSVKGINVEYNSWYYVALTAGLVDYRFRDFAVDRFNKAPQHLYLVRAGIGRLEHNFFILSAYGGKKHLFRGNAASGVTSVTVSGLSAETRWQLTRNVYLNGEIATSYSPDHRSNPPQQSKMFDLSDQSNKAYAVRLTGWWPSVDTRVEGYFKYTGANFLSFSSFQNSAARESWYMRADQRMFKRRLRIVASVRNNEFTNPYVLQRYKSNTVSTSLSATLRLPRWPVVIVGYLPVSQLTKLDSVLVENRFQTFNASAFHQYKIFGQRAASSIMYNRFYNSNHDTGFVYHNAINFYLSQTFFFRQFSASVAASRMKNDRYELNVLDGGIQLHFTKPGTLGFGVKINSMQTFTKLGAYANGAIRIGKNDVIYLSYERNYLPGLSKDLTENDLATIQFTKYFNRRSKAGHK